MGLCLASVVFAGVTSAMPSPMTTYQKEMTKKKKLAEDIKKVLPKAKK